VDLSVVLYRDVQAKNENQSCIDYNIKSQVNLIYGLEAPCTRDVHKGAGHKNGFISQLEMWANATRDGRPAEYRWRPLFNATKFG